MKSANKVSRSKYSAVTCRTTDWRLNKTCWNPGLRRLLFVSLSSSSFLGLMRWRDEPNTDSDSGEMWLKLHVRNKKSDSIQVRYFKIAMEECDECILCLRLSLVSVFTRFHCDKKQFSRNHVVYKTQNTKKYTKIPNTEKRVQVTKYGMQANSVVKLSWVFYIPSQ